MKKLYLLIITIFLFASCVKVEEPQTAENATTNNVVTRSATEKDPYKLSLIQEVLDQHLAKTRSSRIVLEPTHLYVRFLPQDSMQMVAIDALGLNTFYRPIGEEDIEIEEPEVDDDDEQTFYWTYAVVPANFVFPQGITYEIIYESYIQSMNGLSSSSEEQLPTDLYRSILNQTLAMTGNSSTTRAETSQEWSPSARLRLQIEVTPDTDKPIIDTISLPRLNVVVFQGSRREVLRTNSKGETGEYGKFVGSVGFQANWDSDDFIIWQNNNAKRLHTYFNDNTAPLDFVFTGRNYDTVCAALYRAMQTYCYENYASLSGLIRETRFFDVGLKNKNADGWTGRYIWGLRRPLAMYAKEDGEYRTAREIISTAFHELGHASHNYKNNTDYVWAAIMHLKKMESWAEGISYAFMNALFPKYRATASDDKNYTCLMECLLKNGFTLEQLQYDFYGSTGWEQWRERIKERTDKPIDNDFIHMIFDAPNSFRFDSRDMIRSDIENGKYYINQPVMMHLDTYANGTVEKWEVVKGGGLKVIAAPSTSQYFIRFTESGKKVIRATILLPHGVRVTNEKTIEVTDKNIFELSPVIAIGQDITVSLRHLSNYPNARVGKWWADVSGTQNVVISKQTNTSATYNFKKVAAKRKVIAEIIYSPTVKDTCDLSITLGTEMVSGNYRLIKPLGGFSYGTEYAAEYIGDGQLDGRNFSANLRHYFHLIDITDFENCCRVAGNTFYFSISSYNMSMDYKLEFSCSGGGKALFWISNIRDEWGNVK